MLNGLGSSLLIGVRMCRAWSIGKCNYGRKAAYESGCSNNLEHVTFETVVLDDEILAYSRQLHSSTLSHFDHSDSILSAEPNEATKTPQTSGEAEPEGFLFSPPLWGSGYPQDLQYYFVTNKLKQKPNGGSARSATHPARNPSV